MHNNWAACALLLLLLLLLVVVAMLMPSQPPANDMHSTVLSNQRLCSAVS
jgi:hypothetical protein